MNRKIILFDIDGTLLLTGGAGKLAFDRAFSELYAIEGAWQNIHPDGRTDPSLIHELFEKNLGRRPRSEEISRIGEAYTQAMEVSLQEAQHFRVMPGVVELLAELEKREMGLLGLATGNLETTAYLKLERAGLRNYFSFGGFGSDFSDRLQLTRAAVERGRQKLGGWVDPQDILLVGDTAEDVRCGKQLGLTTIAVATGSTSKSSLAALRPDFVVEELTPLDEALLMFGSECPIVQVS
jgi:phosphoglycolate phosphatase-like HAD superfamily hydrolase